MDPPSSGALDVEVLRAEATRFQDAIYALKSRLPKIQHLINRSASISRIPDEILLTIFHAANDAKFSLLVSQVIRRWRQIAIGIPSLWTSIIISPRLRPAAIKTILQHSAGCLLTIRLAFLHCDWPPYLHAVMDIIAKHSTRWREVALELPGWHVQRRIASRICHLEVPSLTHWTVAVDDRQLYDDLPHENVASYNCIGHRTSRPPCLTHLKFVDVPLWRGFRPLHHVTTLHLQTECERLFDGYNEFRGLLSDIPTLVNLILKGHVVDFGVSQISERIELPLLRHFIVDGGIDWESPSGCSDAIFTALNMPVLDSLIIASSEMETPSLLGPNLSSESLKRNEFSLLSSLEIWDFPCHRMTDYLPDLPALSRITLVGSRGHHLLHLLQSKHQQWPNLREITLGPQTFRLTLLDTEEQVDSDVATAEAVYSLIVTRETSSTCASIERLRLDSRVLRKLPSDLLGRLRGHVEVVRVGELPPIDWDQYWYPA